MKNNQYYGIIPPMVTPLEDWDKLDYHGIENLINHILKGGVHGLFFWAQQVKRQATS